MVLSLTRTVQEFSPKEAQALLDNLMPNYRPLDERQVEIYAEMMRSGTWKNTDEPIRKDEEFGLVDGRRRLEAQVRADVTCTFYVECAKYPFLRES